MDEDKLDALIWKYIETGKWDDALVCADYLSKSAPDKLPLYKTILEISLISEKIKKGINSNDDLTVLERIADKYPQLAMSEPFMNLQALADRSKPGTTFEQEIVKNKKNTLDATVKPRNISGQETINGKHVSTESRNNRNIKLPYSSSYRGIAVSIVIALVFVISCNLIGYKYLELYPKSLHGPEASASAYTPIECWIGVKSLDKPVNTIILGSSEAGYNIPTGPVSDELGGATLKLTFAATGSLLSYSWILDYYLSEFGELDNVIFCVQCNGYEYEHDVDFMAAVPLPWGYWDKFNSPPEWKDGEKVDLFISKYLPLYSSSDILAYRLLHPSELFEPQYKRVPSQMYRGGTTANSIDWSNFLDNRPSWYFGAFTPSTDSTTALNNMTELADKYDFQLYIVLGPELDEGYSDPVRQRKLNGLKEYLDQFTGDNVHIVLSDPVTYKTEEMQNPNHLRPDAALHFTEALLADIREINSATD